MQRLYSVIIFLLGILLITIIYCQLPLSEKGILTYISLFCSFTSIYGLILAYLQILSLKQLSIKTQKAVDSSLQELQKVLVISELSKSKKLISEIQNFLHNKDLRGALIRLTDLQETLIQTKYHKDLEKFTLLKPYKDLISNTALYINSINSALIWKNYEKVDRVLIIRNLETTKNRLIEFENELKFKKHDT